MMAELTSLWHGQVVDEQQHMDAAQFWQQVERLATHLKDMQLSCVAVALDNGLPWLVVDFALMQAGIVSLPLPAFFSPEQRQFALDKARPELIIGAADQAKNAAQNGIETWTIGSESIALQPSNLAAPEHAVPQGTQKITFTSGSTGQPKGVCLSAAHMFDVAASLVSRTAVDAPKHLCLLPLPVLLENVAGVYAPMLAGGDIYVPSLTSLGFDGARLTTPQKLLATISEVEPNTLILVPELLKALVQACASGWQAPSSLTFIAVGGAKVAPQLIARAHDLGLPVYQGYGLSEAGSVVSLATGNGAGVGEPLAHVRYEIRDDEMIIKAPTFLGYLGEPNTQSQGFATGDLVRMDNGELHILGRKKNQLILSTGRNISPEWPESLLLSHGPILQAVVVGEGQAFLSALIYCHEAVDDAQLEALIDATNAQLPEYAQIVKTLRLSAPLSAAEGLLSANQRPKRPAINAHFSPQISQLYQE
ncbi:AMP-binding protein [Pseudoalteromonas sp. T1lg88]|uniref:AMP-binding protein n=1 Tax=Pseudoalteromonas sp. T1lg88 TaxID=2077104 RepID=UPI000CF6745B|nr:AMP-binding protein [Pseudoalteromonas sp. T1lg88]